MKLHWASTWGSCAWTCVSTAGSTSVCKPLSVVCTQCLLHLCQAIPINSALEIPSGAELPLVIPVHPAWAAAELTLITASGIKRSLSFV